MYVWVIVDFLLISFKFSLGCLFSPHHVNQGGVQKTTPQVTLYKSHTVNESFRRCRDGTHSQELSGHPGQGWELLLVLFPPYERVWVVGHLLHSHAGIYHGSVSPLTKDGSTSIDVLLTPKVSSKSLGLGTCRSS